MAMFAGRNVLVTGASSGIGRAIAIAFAGQGANVALVARRRDALEQTAAAAGGSKSQLLVAPADVSDRTAVRAAFRKAVRRFGRIDIVVNNAGVMIPARVTDIERKDLQAMLDVNLFGALNVMQAAVTQMRAQAGGNLVNVASLAGRRGLSPIGGYCASKFALVGLTEALRMELVGEPIRVSLVMPGVVDTPMVASAKRHRATRSAWPESLVMPPEWVVWAVFAAVRLGLAEVAVPPGADVVEKLAALMPRATDTLLKWASRSLYRGR